KGTFKGPDLTNIAAERKSNLITDALTKPNHRVYGDGGVHLRALPAMDTYDAVHVTLGNGRTIDGVLLNQDSYSLQLMGDDNQLHLLDRSQVKAVTNKPPLMPTDYDKRLIRNRLDLGPVQAVTNKPPLMPTDYDKRLTKEEFAIIGGHERRLIRN